MNRNRFALTILTCLAFSPVMGQKLLTVKGHINDTSHLPVSSATIRLLHYPDSILVKAAISDKDGQFELTSAFKDSLVLNVSAIGYLPYASPLVLAGSDSIVVRNIVLRKKDSGELEAVTVRASKPLIEQKIDRVVVNVNAFITNAGASALEVLEKSPGVMVSDNGNISLKGRSGVLVFIDDKPVYMSGNDLAAYLRSLPAELLDVVEIMSNPPARYDAAGSGGVINIRLKKSRVKGFNGNAAANFGKAYYTRMNGSFNINYRKNKVNLFSSMGVNQIHNHRVLEIQRIFFDNNNVIRSSFDQSTLIIIKGAASNFRIGTDYFISKNTTIGFVFQGSMSGTNDLRRMTSFIRGQSSQLDSIINAENTGRPKMHRTGYNFNYAYQNKEKARSLSSDLDFIRFVSRNNVGFVNNAFDPAGNPKSEERLKGNVPVNIKIYSATLNYADALAKKLNLETGAKITYTNTNNKAEYFNWLNNSYIPDFDRTNTFHYQEYIGAAYFNLNKEIKKLTIQSGLRFEKTWIQGHQLGNFVKPDSSFRQQYSGLFPTLYFSYQLDSSKNRLLFSYGRRIFRPFYQDLNPFLIPLDKYTFFAGNPELKPQYTNRFELSWLYKNLLNLTLLYSQSNNVQQETIEKKEFVFISRNGNIGTQITKGITVNLSWRTAKWLNSNIYTQVINNHFKGILYSQPLDNQSTSWSVNAVNSFTFKKEWSAELSGFYTSKNIVGQFSMQGWVQLSAGIAKRLMKNRANIRFNVRDMFKSFNASGEVLNIVNARASYQNHFDSQVFTLTFTCNFGKSENIPQRRQTGGAGSEEGRVRSN